MSDEVPEEDVDRIVNLPGSSGDAGVEAPPPPPSAPAWSVATEQGSERTPQLTSPSSTERPLRSPSSTASEGVSQTVSDPTTTRRPVSDTYEEVGASVVSVPVASSTSATYETLSLVSDPDLLTTAARTSPRAPSSRSPPRAPTQPDISLPDIVASNPSDPVPKTELQEVAGASCAHPADPEIKEDEDRVDPVLLAEVLDLGFDEEIVRIALCKTKGAGGAEAAINWILEHHNESDFESEEERDEAMGGVQSSLCRPYKMVFVVNSSLKMGVGKMAAQVAHATLGVYRVALHAEQGESALSAWRYAGEMKVVVRGDSTEQLLELFKQAKDLNLPAYLVADAGRTQIPAGSRTVLGVFGPSETVDQVTGTLKLL